MLPDYHTHTEESKDADSTLPEMCARADKIGLREICFTNHFDIDEIETKRRYIGMTIGELDNFIKKIDEIKSDFKVKIKLGIEFDYREEYEQQIAKLLDDYDFDFVMGSIHFLNGLDITNSKTSGEFFKKFPVEEAYQIYYKQTFKLIESQLFDIVGHIDAIKKYTGVMVEPYSFENYRDMAEKAAQLLVDTDTGTELNMAGFDNPVGEQYPSIEFLKLLNEVGVKKITVGSDSHKAEQLCRHFDKAKEILKQTGFKQVCVFDKRKPRFIDI